MTEANTTDLRLYSDSPLRTEAIGAALGKLLHPGDLICLSGQLGAGKTTLGRGIGFGWGAIPPLSSPSYNLVHEHRREQDSALLLHIDLYRIEGSADAETIGIDDILDSDGCLIIEWHERIRDMLPPNRLRIDIEWVNASARELFMVARGSRYRALLDGLRQAALMET